MFDLKITGGTIVDGTGAPRFQADIGIRDGRIEAIGSLGDSAARETVDAAGRIVAPGFIDAHTHYDAQAFWDPTLSPSCYHGVTTVIGGFCGFSIAPITAEAADYIKPMLARVEGMPLDVLDSALPWNWSSFGEYLARLDGRLGLNAGFFAGHSPIRRIVMGERAVGEKATADDLKRMVELLDTSLAEGALGFSTTISHSHVDGDGKPVPSRWADHSEIVELARVVSRHEGTGLELLPGTSFTTEVKDLLTDVSVAGNRPVNWNVLVATSLPEAQAQIAQQLSASDYARERGGEVIALTLPCPTEIHMNLRTGVTFDFLPGVWREMFAWPLEERIRKFRDPKFRKQVADDTASITGTLKPLGSVGDYVVVAVVHEPNKQYEGRKIADIAQEWGTTPIDVLFDIAIADNLDTLFRPDLGGDDHESYRIRAGLWADDRTLIGASDAGAHLDVIDTFAYATSLLQKGVREHKVISLEQAIHKITQRTATYFGLIDRGLIRQGYHADIVIFDEETVGRGPAYRRFDLPGNEDFRIYAEAEGIDHVFVNGVRIVEGGRHKGTLPGKVLRSGTDTKTVAMDALRSPRAA